MSWSVTDYVTELKKRGARCTGQNAAIEAELLRLFPPDERGVSLYDPCVIADCKGRIMLWFLPGIVSPKRKVDNSTRVSITADGDFLG